MAATTDEMNLIREDQLICWNCFRDHGGMCPFPERSIAEREQLRRALGAPMPSTRYWEEVSSTLLCFNCWDSTLHDADHCSKPAEPIFQRELLRVRKGITLSLPWATILVEQGLRPMENIDFDAWMRGNGVYIIEIPDGTENNGRTSGNNRVPSKRGRNPGRYNKNGNKNSFPCFNCWETSSHASSTCSKDWLPIVERERLRQQKNVPLPPPWKMTLYVRRIRPEDVWDLDRLGEPVGKPWDGPAKPKGGTYKRYDYTQDILRSAKERQKILTINTPDVSVVYSDGDRSRNGSEEGEWVTPEQDDMLSLRGADVKSKSSKSDSVVIIEPKKNTAGAMKGFVRGEGLKTLDVHCGTSKPTELKTRERGDNRKHPKYIPRKNKPLLALPPSDGESDGDFSYTRQQLAYWQIPAPPLQPKRYKKPVEEEPAQDNESSVIPASTHSENPLSENAAVGVTSPEIPTTPTAEDDSDENYNSMSLKEILGMLNEYEYKPPTREELTMRLRAAIAAVDNAVDQEDEYMKMRKVNEVAGMLMQLGDME